MEQLHSNRLDEIREKRKKIHSYQTYQKEIQSLMSELKNLKSKLDIYNKTNKEVFIKELKDYHLTIEEYYEIDPINAKTITTPYVEQTFYSETQFREPYLILLRKLYTYQQQIKELGITSSDTIEQLDMEEITILEKAIAFQ